MNRRLFRWALYALATVALLLGMALIATALDGPPPPSLGDAT